MHSRLPFVHSVALVAAIVFKGKGTPDGVYCQWPPKGSYRLENMLETISRLPNRVKSIFSHKTYAIYILDKYSIHLQPKVKSALLKRGYILVGVGGSITSDVNDTDLHAPLKKKYLVRDGNIYIFV